MAIISTKPSMNYGIWGSNGNITVPTSEKVEQGHIVEKPKAEIVNWIENRQDSFLQYINQRGIPTWDSTTEYPSGAYVVRSGILYKALSQNQDKDPTSNTAIWTIAFTSYSDFVNLSSIVTEITNTDEYLNLYVSKANPVMTAECKGVSYLDQTGVSGITFSGTSPEILKDNVVVGTFTGTSSAKDIVTVEMLQLYLQQYKVGDIYLTTNPANPSVTFGYGTWERYGQGRALVGVSTVGSDPDWTKGVSSIFGEYKHTQTLEELFPHTHRVGEGSVYPTYNGDLIYASGDDKTATADSYSDTSKVGGGQPFNIVQPSITVFVWRRTA